MAACSSDSTRLTSLSTPFPATQAASPEVTGSLGAAPTGRVDAAPIGSPHLAAAAPSGPPVAYAPATTAPVNSGQPLYGAPNYASAPSSPARASGSAHVVVGGETVASVARSYNMTAAQLASANNLTPDSPLRIGQTLMVPAGTAGNLAAQSRPVTPATKPAQVTVAPVAPPVAAAPAKVAAVPPAAKVTTGATDAAAVMTPAAPAAAATPASGAKVATAAKVTPAEDADDGARTPGSGPQFRAPVRGRVISGFGPKPGGAKNDGVNFAVPEGTSVRAAEDGTVAYAGNELKGYGNLVLIKHADGYVTAYAHASELTVKRGDTVRRGQIVAKAGQSGGVSTPQLHFEIRKGSQPVDPSQYVAGL
ncbi:MAG: hypothetical protein B7Z15_10820 [Rhizobiales bacterium 32-66-8]|nr:MAG: hypothetical protein B7Z15_10820 [Rhizobiales bacterium 32-66-8]